MENKLPFLFYFFGVSRVEVTSFLSQRGFPKSSQKLASSKSVLFLPTNRKTLIKISKAEEWGRGMEGGARGGATDRLLDVGGRRTFS